MTRILASLTFLAVVVSGCDGGATSTEPVGFSPRNLEGYWAEVGTSSPWPTPMHLHFGVTTFEGETPPGLPTVEFNGLGVAGYTLEDGRIEGTDASGAIRFTAVVQSLTRDTMVLRYGALDHTFERVDGCGGPGVWFTTQVEHSNTTDIPPNVVTATDVVFGVDGSLHMITSMFGGRQEAYTVVPPGRCTPWVPHLGPRGQSIDIASDGRIWMVRSRDVGELQLYEIPKQPWAREALDTADWVLEEASMVATAPPPTRVIEDEDGDPMVLWAYGGTLHTTRVKGDAFIRDAIELGGSGGLTPSRLTLKHLPDGVLVRGDRTSGGVIYHTSGPKVGTWSSWKAETLPGGDGTAIGGLATVFDIAADGTVYAAWVGGEPGQPVLTLGRKARDGDWETLPVGRGSATDLRVLPDGSVDIVGTLWHNGGVQVWTHVPAGFAADTWHQSYRPPTDPGTHSGGGNPGALALTAFGPAREVFMGMPNAPPSWTRPAAGHDARRVYQEVALTFTHPSVTRVHFPTVGVECTSDCTLTMPVGAVVPVRIETDAPETVSIANTPAWPLGGDAVDGQRSWLITIPMMHTPRPSTPRRIPLAVEIGVSVL